MKKLAFTLMLFAPLGAFCQQPLKLWYQEPAKRWTQALPVGNGRLGAIIFGKVNNELIQLNESTCGPAGRFMEK